MRICILGSGLIGMFYSMAIQGKRGRRLQAHDLCVGVIAKEIIGAVDQVLADG